MKPRAIFVGAGPVGLMTAIQAKLYDPNLPILMIEKHSEYQRKHLLSLNPSSFAETHPDSEFQEMIKKLPERIRTNELEATLLEYANKLGIKIEYSSVTDCKELASRYPDAEIIVGADGSHSIVHQQVFDNQYQIKRTLKYIAEVKYEAEGKTMPLHLLSQALPAMTYANHLVSEYVGKEKEGHTPVALRIFIDEKTYDQMKAATFKNPFSLSQPEKIEPSLRETINTWLKAREKMADERPIKNSDRITVTNLPVYASKYFVKERYGKTYFLVGDAAFGVPYFRALNNGILCSSRLAKVIHAMVNHLQIEDDYSISSSIPKREKPTQYYANYVKALVKHEDFVASLKTMGVSSLESTAAVSRAVPYLKRASLLTTEQGRNFKTSMRSESISSPHTSFSMFSKFPESKNDVQEPESNHHKTQPGKPCIIL